MKKENGKALDDRYSFLTRKPAKLIDFVLGRCEEIDDNSIFKLCIKALDRKK